MGTVLIQAVMGSKGKQLKDPKLHSALKPHEAIGKQKVSVPTGLESPSSHFPHQAYVNFV